MSRLLKFALAFVVAVPSWAAEPADPPRRDPLDIGLEEHVDRRLVLIDTLVLDRDDRPVAGLSRDDFEIVADGKVRALDTLDVVCEEGGIAEPVAVRSAARRPPLGSAGPRNIVFALDYLHLAQQQRVEVLDALREAVAHTLSPEDQVMIAALTGGLRIEQTFTTDRERLAETLKRMEYDISLWEPSFAHLNEQGFFRGLDALVTALEHVPGAKAIVLYSNSHANLSDPNDLAFARLAADVAAARCAIYPVHAAGLTTTPASVAPNEKPG